MFIYHLGYESPSTEVVIWTMKCCRDSRYHLIDTPAVDAAKIMGEKNIGSASSSAPMGAEVYSPTAIRDPGSGTGKESGTVRTGDHVPDVVVPG